MLPDYESYLKQPLALSFGECLDVYRALSAALGDDPGALELYGELLENCAEYAALRAAWTVNDGAWKSANDASRTRKHNALITRFDMLAHYLSGCGRSDAWRDTLGYEDDDPYSRKRIGDFACFLTYIAGIGGR